MSSTMLSDFMTVVRSEDFLVLDTETTGLHDAEIVQIAIINQYADLQYEEFVKPTVPIPVEATAVHGIDDALVADALSWASVWREVADLLAGRNVIVYNVDFDRAVLYSATKISGLPAWGWLSGSQWFCAMRAFAEVYGVYDVYHHSFRWQTLATAIAHFGDVEPQTHSALADCRSTLFVSQCMAGLTIS